ncbi:hypothetical protein [Limosilactobacillus reuteri]|uniref:hypothetical protein n=1 Tax=Limosilactobacillus reuteri TaxID=1598 RepID=UPI00143DF560|nr:hypothetical protein [Limosilactobacillus reuteri]QIZ04278.1 hypothetical protein GXL24_04565 [Limosilactobacillus reuteri]
MKRFRNKKDDNAFTSSSTKRINRILSGDSTGELASHTGHGYTSYTFMTEDHSEKARQNFTSGGTRHAFELAREGNHWALDRTSGDIRRGILEQGRGYASVNGGRTIRFKTLSEAKSKAEVLPPEAVSKIKTALKDYRKISGKGKHGSSGKSSG